MFVLAVIIKKVLLFFMFRRWSICIFVSGISSRSEPASRPTGGCCPGLQCMLARRQLRHGAMSIHGCVGLASCNRRFEPTRLPEAILRNIGYIGRSPFPEVPKLCGAPSKGGYGTPRSHTAWNTARSIPMEQGSVPHLWNRLFSCGRRCPFHTYETRSAPYLWNKLFF